MYIRVYIHIMYTFVKMYSEKLHIYDVAFLDCPVFLYNEWQQKL